MGSGAEAVGVKAPWMGKGGDRDRKQEVMKSPRPTQDPPYVCVSVSTWDLQVKVTHTSNTGEGRGPLAPADALPYAALAGHSHRKGTSCRHSQSVDEEPDQSHVSASQEFRR